MIEIAITLFTVAAMFVFARCTSRKLSDKFNQRWPPITEDEFVARCAPGTSRDTALRVRRIISEQLGVPYDQIYPEQDFVGDLNAD